MSKRTIEFEGVLFTAEVNYGQVTGGNWGEELSCPTCKGPLLKVAAGSVFQLRGTSCRPCCDGAVKNFASEQKMADWQNTGWAAFQNAIKT